MVFGWEQKPNTVNRNTEVLVGFGAHQDGVQFCSAFSLPHRGNLRKPCHRRHCFHKEQDQLPHEQRQVCWEKLVLGQVGECGKVRKAVNSHPTFLQSGAVAEDSADPGELKGIFTYSCWLTGWSVVTLIIHFTSSGRDSFPPTSASSHLFKEAAATETVDSASSTASSTTSSSASRFWPFPHHLQ